MTSDSRPLVRANPQSKSDRNLVNVAPLEFGKKIAWIHGWLSWQSF